MEKIKEQQQEQEQQQNPTNESKSNFKEGDLITLVRVRFPGNAKSFPFLLGSKTFRYGQKVIAMSDRGMTVGYINSFPYEIKFNKSMLPLKVISKVADDNDLSQQQEFLSKEREAEKVCNKLVIKHKLDMTITHVEFIQFGKKAVFYFIAPARIDFRNLVKDLVGDLKMRIELRQISVRDRTAAIGAIGPCGLQTCCSSFLSSYGHVSIKMAKNQNLSIAQSRINGVCGQIKCCMKYEDKVYSHKREKLPKEGAFIKLANGDIGKVTKLHIIQEKFDLLTDKGIIKRYPTTIYTKNNSAPPSSWSFPKEFDLITNETDKTVVWESPQAAEQHHTSDVKPKDNEILEQREVLSVEKATNSRTEQTQSKAKGKRSRYRGQSNKKRP